MRVFQQILVCAGLALTAFTSVLSAAPLNLAQRPLNTGTPPAPNIIVTIDDSGSMYESDCYQTATVYPFPLTVTGAPIIVPFLAAPNDGWTSLTASPRDLTTAKDCSNVNYGNYPAFAGRTLAEERQNIANFYSFYRHRLNKVKSALSRSFSPNVLPDTTIRLGFQSLNSCASLAGGTCRQKSGGATSGGPLFENRLRVLDTAQRQNFYNFFSKMEAPGSTPLVEALGRVGEYYKSTDLNGPMASVPGTANAPILSCRRNYHVMLTDGQWNGSNSHGAGDLDNTSFSLPDGVAFTPRTPYTKSNSGSTLGDIALHYWKTDLQPSVMNDVSPLIRVPGTTNTYGTQQTEYWNAQNNPATWQHMVNYMIGVDLSETLIPGSSFPAWGGSTFATNPDGYAAVLAGTRNWPNMSSFNDRTYDLWHAAINSRGEFFSADNPTSVENAFRDVIRQILAARSAGQTVGGSGPAVVSGFAVYRGNYESDMSGTLVKTEVDSSGAETTTSWEAGAKLKLRTPSSRAILTHNGSSFVPFKWTSLSPAQQALLDLNGNGVVDSLGSLRLDWLRGAKTHENGQLGAMVPSFRARGNSPLGSIVHSAPVNVGRTSAGYQDAGYLAYLNTTIRMRDPVVYVGANDGMLHGFRDSDGEEIIAYVPKAVYPNLNQLTDPAYTSRFYVNGSPQFADAYAGGRWRTLLVSGLGGGGKGVVMLDVSNPSTFSEANASTVALLDMNGADDPDMGHIIGTPPKSAATGQSRMIGKLKNGKTVLVVGNGVNSANENPVLFVYHLDNLPANGAWVLGTNYFKIALPGGQVSGSNGLAMPVLTDNDGDGLLDAVYAGDLKGNVWKFEASATDPSGLQLANSSAPLFSAPTVAGKPQPITAPVTIFAHPDGGHMVIFGTGQLLQEVDPNNSQGQTIYGVWDKPGSTATVPLNSLVAQTITSTGSAQGLTLRYTSKNDVNYAGGKRGWYINLPSLGERVVTAGLLVGRGVIIPSVIPSSANGETCSPGASPGYWTYFDALTGRSSNNAVLQINGLTPAQKKANSVSVSNGEASPFLAKLGTKGARSSTSASSESCSTTRRAFSAASGAVNIGSMGRCGRIGWTQIKE
jgi:type IV pilus assembly protein PilY1